MQIQLAEKTDQQRWDAYVLSHPSGLAYHQYAWKLAIEDAYRFPGIYLIAVKNGQVCGVLPLIDFKVPLRRRTLISLPYCDVGGVLANDEEIETALKQAALLHMRKSGCKELLLRCAVDRNLEGVSEDLWPPKVRMVLSLPDSSEYLLSGFKSKLRSQIKKPLRDGLSTQLGGQELVGQFYSVFTQNMRELGSPVHSLKWIRSIVAVYGDNARIGIVSTPEDLPVAAGIILLHGRTVSIPWASSLRRFKSLNPNVLLYWKFLEFSANNGFDLFDFGRSTPGEGTYKFKEQWGAKPIPLDWCSVQSSEIEEIRNVGVSANYARRFFEQIWHRLPLVICNVVGPRIRRYIDL